MALIHKPEIPALVDLFNRRNVKLHHACQLKDLEAYLALGGVPSRNLLERSGLQFTAFDTDNADKRNEVWTKVFGNLSDFGFWYAYGTRKETTAPTPNPFGPILLKLDPEAMNEAHDIAICLRSAGGRDFQREAESLSSVDEVNRLFIYPIDDGPNEYAKSRIKFQQALKTEFGNQLAMSPEISFAVNNEKLSFDYLGQVIVDPYIVNGLALSDRVAEVLIAAGIGIPVWDRRYKEENRIEVIRELSEALSNEIVRLDDIVGDERYSESLRDWANRLLRGNKRFEFKRFAEYLRSGTLLELS